MIMPQNSSTMEKNGGGGPNSAGVDVLNLTPQQQDTIANFDKTSFLSDQVILMLTNLSCILFLYSGSNST